jgi:hypothetical protein
MLFAMARKPKAKSVAAATGGDDAFYRYRYLMGAMQQAQLTTTVRLMCIQADVDRIPEIGLAWRTASTKMQALAMQEAGAPDQIEIADLPAALRPRAAEIGSDTLFQASFSSMPTTIKVVEIDKLIAPQREVNLDYVESLCARVPGTKLSDLMGFCVGPRTPPELRKLQTALNQMTFSSRSLDLRFLSGSPKPLTQDDIDVAHGGGRPVEAITLLVGFGADPINAFHVGSRIVLNNGFHRIFALKKMGVTHAPMVLQEVANVDIEFPESLLALPRGYLLQHPRPVLIKDFFDDGLVTEVRLKPRRKVLKVTWSVEESVAPE